MITIKCEECGVGRCQPLTTSYIRMLGRHVVVLPNAPAAKCDMCGNISYDPRFLEAMHHMFHQLLEDKRQVMRRQKRVTEQSPAWSAARRGR